MILSVYGAQATDNTEVVMQNSSSWKLMKISSLAFPEGYGAVPMVVNPYSYGTPGMTLRTLYSEFTIKPPPGFAPWDYPRQAYTIITPTKPYSSDVTVHHVESVVDASPDSTELVGFVADDKSKFAANPLLVCNGTASLGTTLNSSVSTVSTGIYKAPVDLTKFATITSGGAV